MLPDLHIGFLRGRSGGLVFPSLSEFSTDYCDYQSIKEKIASHTVTEKGAVGIYDLKEKEIVLPLMINFPFFLLPVQETWVRSLGREDPLEKEMATHSSILAWRIP